MNEISLGHVADMCDSVGLAWSLEDYILWVSVPVGYTNELGFADGDPAIRISLAVSPYEDTPYNVREMEYFASEEEALGLDSFYDTTLVCSAVVEAAWASDGASLTSLELPIDCIGDVLRVLVWILNSEVSYEDAWSRILEVVNR